MNDYALVADRVWDGTADTAQVGIAVMIHDDRIADLIPHESLSPTLPQVELPGCTLIPGLMDAHVHYSAVMGPAFLAAGVTTIRDVGNDLDWILRQRELSKGDLARGPGIVCCGQLLDGSPAHWQRMGRPHSNTDELRASVREHVARGVDQIKLYAHLDLEMVRAGVDEAHGLKKFVVAHLGVAVEDAAVAGLDEFEHLSGCAVAWRSATQDEDDTAIDVLLQHNVVIDPTFVVWDRLGRILDRALHHDARRIWAHPCHCDIWNRYVSRFEAPAGRLRLQEAMPHLKRFLRRAHERGVVIALGTDTPFPHLIPGFSVHDELAMYADAGLRPIDALRSATSVNAKVLGVAARTGKIEAGLMADLVAIRGNPCERIDDISNVVLVIREGRRLEIEQLLAAMQEAAANAPDDPITNDLLDYVGHRDK